jgi:hypothetical protein
VQRKILIFLLFFTFFYSKLPAQLNLVNPPEKEKRWFFINAGIGYFSTAGDWSQRYPTHLSVPISVEYLHRSSWVLGGDYSFFLGSNVTEDNLYGPMANAEGTLLDMSGYPAIVRTYQRGFSSRVYALKSWILKKEKNARYLIQAGGGLGYVTHFTKFVFDMDQLPQIDREYQGGYNQHFEGLSSFQQLRFQYVNNDAISFHIALEAGQHQGQRIHPYDFATQTSTVGKTYKDQYYGAVFSIMIPIHYRDRISEVDYYVE